MLIYIGEGHAHVGIPARDLSDAEVKEHGGEKKLLATGLYIRPDFIEADPSDKKQAGKKTPAKGEEE